MIFVTRLLRNPAQMADFCAIFLHKTGFLCKFLSVSFTFLERSDEKIRGRNAKFRAPEFFFRGSKFYFRGSDEKIPVQKLFRGGFRGVFPSRWNFFPDTFPVSFCRRNPQAGFPAGRVSAPGVSRVPSEGQVWRGFRDILIFARRVWLRSFRTVPARRPNTRISGGENEQIVNAHPEVSFCQWKEVRRGRISFRAGIRIISPCRETLSLLRILGVCGFINFYSSYPHRISAEPTKHTCSFCTK